jgi:hypothetical protein
MRGDVVEPLAVPGAVVSAVAGVTDAVVGALAGVAGTVVRAVAAAHVADAVQVDDGPKT